MSSSPTNRQSGLVDDTGALLDALAPSHLVEIGRRAALEGLQGICRRELGGRILADIVAQLFPDFPPAKIAEVTRQIGLNAIRNACLKTIANAPGPWEATVRCPDRAAADQLRTHEGPAILAFWHFGPVTLLPLGLRRIGVKSMIITRANPTRWTRTPDFAKLRIPVSGEDHQQSIVALRQSISHLNEGGRVAIAVDGSLGKRDLVVPFLGRRFAVSRGLAGLARITNAPIFPCTMQWERDNWNLAIRVFERVTAPAEDEADAFEQKITEATVRCFERYGRRCPRQFTIDQLAEIADSPALDS